MQNIEDNDDESVDGDDLGDYVDEAPKSVLVALRETDLGDSDDRWEAVAKRCWKRPDIGKYAARREDDIQDDATDTESLIDWNVSTSS